MPTHAIPNPNRPAGADNDPVNRPASVDRHGPDRRDLLLKATGAMGAVGGVAVAYPFISSFKPSELARAQGGPVEVDIADLKTGELLTVAWRGKPVWLMRRSDEVVANLRDPNPALADPMSIRSEQPASCQNPTRSIKPEVLVTIGLCTHLGCLPNLRQDDPQMKAAMNRANGFFCPCHGSRFDMAGRVVKNVPAPLNLVIPDHRYLSASKVRIG